MNKVPFNPNENNNNSASTWPDSRSASCFCIEILELTYWDLAFQLHLLKNKRHDIKCCSMFMFFKKYLNLTIFFVPGKGVEKQVFEVRANAGQESGVMKRLKLRDSAFWERCYCYQFSSILPRSQCRARRTCQASRLQTRRRRQPKRRRALKRSSTESRRLPRQHWINADHPSQTCRN